MKNVTLALGLNIFVSASMVACGSSGSKKDAASAGKSTIVKASVDYSNVSALAEVKSGLGLTADGGQSQVVALGADGKILIDRSLIGVPEEMIFRVEQSKLLFDGSVAMTVFTIPKDFNQVTDSLREYDVLLPNGKKIIADCIYMLRLKSNGTVDCLVNPPAEGESNTAYGQVSVWAGSFSFTESTDSEGNIFITNGDFTTRLSQDGKATLIENFKGLLNNDNYLVQPLDSWDHIVKNNKDEVIYELTETKDFTISGNLLVSRDMIVTEQGSKLNFESQALDFSNSYVHNGKLRTIATGEDNKVVSVTIADSAVTEVSTPSNMNSTNSVLFEDSLYGNIDGKLMQFELAQTSLRLTNSAPEAKEVLEGVTVTKLEVKDGKLSFTGSKADGSNAAGEIVNNAVTMYSQELANQNIVRVIKLK